MVAIPWLCRVHRVKKEPIRVVRHLAALHKLIAQTMIKNYLAPMKKRFIYRLVSSMKFTVILMPEGPTPIVVFKGL